MASGDGGQAQVSATSPYMSRPANPRFGIDRARETNARFGTGTHQPARFTTTMRAALLLPASMATVLESGRADRDRDPMAAVSQLARFDPIAPPRMPMPRWRTRRCAHIFKRCSGLCCSWWLLDARA